MTAIKNNRTTLTLKTGADLTYAIEVKIGYLDPDEIAGELTAEVKGDPTNGEIIKTFEFNKAGYWRLWAIVDNVDIELGQEDFVYVYPEPGTEKKIVSPAFIREVFPDITVSDLVLRELIDVVQADYRVIRNAPFYGEGTDLLTFPEGSKLTAAKMARVQVDHLKAQGSIERESLGSYSVTYDKEAFYGKGITNSITSYVRIGDARHINNQVYESRFRTI